MEKTFDTKSGQELIDELLNLYYICEQQCKIVEQIIRELDTNKKI